MPKGDWTYEKDSDPTKQKASKFGLENRAGREGAIERPAESVAALAPRKESRS